MVLWQIDHERGEWVVNNDRDMPAVMVWLAEVIVVSVLQANAASHLRKRALKKETACPDELRLRDASSMV